MWNGTRESFQSGHYGLAALGAVIYTANELNVIAGFCAQSTIGFAWNAGVDYASGFMRGDWDMLMRGSINLLSIGLSGKLAEMSQAPASAPTNGLKALSKADEYGIKSYDELRGILKGSDLQAHHLYEKRFANILGVNAREMESIAASKAEHQVFTNAWRKAIPYGEGTANATLEQVNNAARQIYKNYPEILKALGL